MQNVIAFRERINAAWHGILAAWTHVAGRYHCPDRNALTLIMICWIRW